MPKFKFPLPGRKHSSTKDKDNQAERTNLPIKSPAFSMSNGLSKAQRFFGTENDLSIDSPTKDDGSWQLSSSRSSAMSISISESSQATRSTAETGSVQSTQENQWELESGVFPTVSRARGKASSTLLGQRYGDDAGSISSGQLRNVNSSSTLKSYYDRQKSPLAISQQTSASSSRDLALRKGLPVVIPRSPLLQVESVNIFDSDFTGDLNGAPMEGGLAYPTQKEAKKKPSMLDFSMLFPRPGNSRGNRSPGSSSQSSSPLSTRTNAPTPLQASPRRKLTKPQSRESLRSTQNIDAYIRSDGSQERQTVRAPLPSNDSYEHLSARSHMAQIPELEVPLMPEPWAGMEGSHSGLYSLRKPASLGKNQQGTPTSATSERHPWSEPRSAMRPSLMETSSAASISSHNTKTSRRTGASAFSTMDLKEKSVLSLSSGSEGEDSDSEPIESRAPPRENKASRVLNGSSVSYEERRHSKRPSSGSPRSTPQSARKGGAHVDRFSSIPEAAVSHFRPPGHVSQTDGVASSYSIEKAQSARRISTKPEAITHTPAEQRESRRVSSVPKQSRHSKSNSRDSRYSAPRESRVSSKPSITSKRSSQQPTPPLSPTSVEFKVEPEQNNRFMAVTEQEEALLAALRQKKARMREEIIEAHEINRSPPRTAEQPTENRAPEGTLPSQNGPRKQQVLLYLDTPISEGQPIDTAEPSPDLSDFLSFGSDEESTPRTSWQAAPVPSSGAPRPDSSISMHPPRADYARANSSPMTPPSAARLSAVGGSVRLKERERRSSRSSDRRKPASIVRFVDDAQARARAEAQARGQESREQRQAVVPGREQEREGRGKVWGI